MSNAIKIQNESFAKSARKILKKSYMRRLVPEDEGGYSASIQEFPGCFAEGDTADEALQRLDDAAESWIAGQLANGVSIREPIDFVGASGKIALRIPRGLHKQVAELADLEECSINQLLTTAISEYVSRVDLLHKVGAALKSCMVSAQIVTTQEWAFPLDHVGPFRLPDVKTLLLEPLTTQVHAVAKLRELSHD